MVDEYIRLSGKTKYGKPVGKCIYCGVLESKTEKLTDEHIVPYSLGADAYLPQASCKNCAKITSYLEGYASREIFGPLRIFYNIQSRRKKIDLNDLEVQFESASGTRVESISRSKLPPILFLPLVEPAGIFFDREPSPMKEIGVWRWQTNDFEERMKQLCRPGEFKYSFSHFSKANVFGRTLAKIAHTVAISSLGVDTFEPFLPPVILGADKNVGFLVGAHEGPTPAEVMPIGTLQKSHSIAFSAMAADGTPPILAASIRLFPFTGAPSYYVVIGKPGPSALQQLEAPASPT